MTERKGNCGNNLMAEVPKTREEYRLSLTMAQDLGIRLRSLRIN